MIDGELTDQLDKLIDVFEAIRWVDVPGIDSQTASAFHRRLVEARSELLPRELVTDGGLTDEQRETMSQLATNEVQEAARKLTNPEALDPDGAAVLLNDAAEQLAAISDVHESLPTGGFVLQEEDAPNPAARERVVELIHDVTGAGLGEFKLTPETVAANVGLPTDRAREILEELEAEGQVEQVAQDLYTFSRGEDVGIETDRDGDTRASTAPGPVYAEYRLGDTTREVENPAWAVMPTDDPEETALWLDLIGHDLGEWSAKFTPEQARRLIDALAAAANECEVA